MSMSLDTTSLESLYIEQLTDLQRKIYEIAKTRLQSSFCLTQSIGYKEWLQTYKVQLENDKHISQSKPTPPG